MSGERKPSTERFSGRAAAYDRGRPCYPAAIMDHLFSVGALFPGCEVADLGSGTGIFSALLLDRGLLVYAVEPNQDMRSMAEARLAGRKGFVSVAGSAEGTTLPDRSMDAATAAQAFHWFDLDRTREEMKRILRPSGQVVLVWNDRIRESGDFDRAYEELVERHAREKERIDALRQEPELRFYTSDFHRAEFEHSEEHDLESLECLIASASYMPKQGEEGYAEMIAELGELFRRQQHHGKVLMHYRAKCIHGALD